MFTTLEWTDFILLPVNLTDSTFKVLKTSSKSELNNKVPWCKILLFEINSEFPDIFFSPIKISLRPKKWASIPILFNASIIIRIYFLKSEVFF